MTNTPPHIEAIPREGLASLIASRPLVIIHLHGFSFDSFIPDVAAHFQADYHDKVRFGYFNYNQVLGHQAWLPKYFGKWSIKGDGYYLFVEGSCVAFHDGGGASSSETSVDNSLTLGAVLVAIVQKSTAPIVSTLEVINRGKAQRIISHFEPIVQKMLPRLGYEDSCQQPSSTSKTKKRKPHEVLGVEANATVSDIKTAYHARMGKNHPDKVAHMSEAIQKAAEAETLDIQEAYQQLQKDRKTA